MEDIILVKNIKIGPIIFKKGKKITTKPQGDGIVVTSELMNKLVKLNNDGRDNRNN